MSEYSAEDFAAAQFAIDPSQESPLDRCWMRTGGGVAPWSDTLATFRSDSQMAKTGCIPVYAEPYSPEALQRAWEHGEKPGQDEQHTTDGMVTVVSSRTEQGRAITVYANLAGAPLFDYERIIYRPTASEPAPPRDPVDDLAEALADALPEEAGSAIALRRYAEALARIGVRVTDDE